MTTYYTCFFVFLGSVKYYLSTFHFKTDESLAESWKFQFGCVYFLFPFDGSVLKHLFAKHAWDFNDCDLLIFDLVDLNQKKYRDSPC